MTLRISALVTNYNYGRFLAAAVGSALSQTRAVAEVVVVDDGSTDDSRAVLERLAEEHPGLVVPVFQQNAGQEAAVNAGVERCSGDAVAMLDADDLWDDGKVAKVAAALEANPGTSMVVHRTRLIDADRRVLAEDVAGPLRGGDLAPLMLRTGGAWVFPATSSLTLRRDALDRIVPIPPGRWQNCADGALAYPASFLGGVAVVDQVLGSYRVHGTNNHFASNFDWDKVQADVEATNRYLNDFLARAGRPERVDLERNLHYRRDRYYRRGGGPREALAVARLIASWPLYSPADRVRYLARFAVKATVGRRSNPDAPREVA